MAEELCSRTTLKFTSKRKLTQYDVYQTANQSEKLVFILYVGIDPVIWEQAKKDNPDPENLIPVPMIGFAELRNRLQHQEFMSKQHQSRLDVSTMGKF